MTELKNVFRELFNREPLIMNIPNWSHLSSHDFVMSNGLEAPACIQLAISTREDSQLHFYNDAYQSHISGLVTSDNPKESWHSPIEDITRYLLKRGYPIRGFNLYFKGMKEKKKGKTFELLLKTAALKMLDSLYHLNIERDETLRIICGTNEDSVLDALFLSQIIPQMEREISPVQ